MSISGWGRHPRIKARTDYFETDATLLDLINDSSVFVPRGLGRSYGDSALSERCVTTTRFNAILDFDENTGTVICEAGMGLNELINAFLPRGWFLPVTPGTKFITLGGAVASDVHGKNHHSAGCFSQWVDWFDLMLPNGQVMRCSTTDNLDLFRATCGGMGLTGLIMRVCLRLKKVNSSYIIEKRYRARNLDHILDLFEDNAATTYTVAWMDCLAKGDNQGRSILFAGEHSDDGRLDRAESIQLTMPVDLPTLCLNRWSVAAFNQALYMSTPNNKTHLVHLDKFFYPLDTISHWNRMYGRAGFTQYQFVIPYEAGREGLSTVLTKISEAGLGSFLVVFKLFGSQNDNLLSFPTNGYTLALDFKIQPQLFQLLDELDAIVHDHAGRLYLTKDVRMSAQIFRRGYPRWSEFDQIRQQHGLRGAIQSLQSRRLEI